MDRQTRALIDCLTILPNDLTTRLVLADRLNDVGRIDEEILCRHIGLPIVTLRGVILADPKPLVTLQYLIRPVEYMAAARSLKHALDSLEDVRISVRISEERWQVHNMFAVAREAMRDVGLTVTDYRGDRIPLQPRERYLTAFVQVQALGRLTPADFDLFHRCTY